MSERVERVGPRAVAEAIADRLGRVPSVVVVLADGWHVSQVRRDDPEIVPEVDVRNRVWLLQAGGVVAEGVGRVAPHSVTEPIRDQLEAELAQLVELRFRGR